MRLLHIKDHISEVPSTTVLYAWKSIERIYIREGVQSTTSKALSSEVGLYTIIYLENVQV